MKYLKYKLKSIQILLLKYLTSVKIRIYVVNNDRVQPFYEIPTATSHILHNMHHS